MLSNKSILFFGLCAGVLFSGCGTKTQIAPNLENFVTNSHRIYAKFASQKDYMKKYLPKNISLNENAKISVIYEFADNAKSSSWDEANLFNPLALVGFPSGNNNLTIAGNLKFYNDKTELKFSSVCVASKSRSLFSDADFTELRKIRAQQLAENLEKQINLSFEKGEFDVFE